MNAKMNLNQTYQSTSNERTNNSWYMPLPDVNPVITNYSGPYPLGELQVTRYSILRSLKGQFSVELRHKLGLTPDGRRFVYADIKHKSSDQVSLNSDWNISKFDLNEPFHDKECPRTSKQRELTSHTPVNAADEFHTDGEPPQNVKSQTVYDGDQFSTGYYASRQTSQNVNRDDNKNFLSLSKSDSVPVSSSHPGDIPKRKSQRLWKKSNAGRLFHSDMDLEDNSRIIVDTSHRSTNDKFCNKCDTCDFVSHGEHKMEMMSHLRSTSHLSASYCLAKGQDSLTPLCILDPVSLHLKLKGNVDQTISSSFVMCPICSAVFKNSYFCAFHIRDVHKIPGSKDYGLSSVIEKKTVLITRELVCSVCNKRLASASELHQHLKTKKHYPFSVEKKNEKLMFFCPYCMRQDYMFLSMRDHVRQCCTHKENFAIQIVYLEMPPVKKKLLSYPDNMSTEDKMKRDIHVMKCIKTAEKSKFAKRRLRKKIEAMTDALRGYQSK